MKKLALVLALAALAVAAGVGYAAIPAANGTISACKDAKGTLKVIDAESGQTCNANQQLLQWNQQGPPGFSGYEVVTGNTASENSGSKLVILECPAGKRALGGGGSTASAIGRHLQVYANHPSPDGRWWYYGVLEEDPIDNGLYAPTAYVICAAVAP